MMNIPFILFTTLATYYDIKTSKIPNALNVIGLLSGLVYGLIFSSWSGLEKALFGTLIGFSLTYILFCCKALAAGDVKFFAAAGAWLGAYQVFYLLILSVLLSAVFAVWIIMKRKHWRAGTFPFMYAVFPAACCIWWLI
jgi:prepilin peptidase CpaA